MIISIILCFVFFNATFSDTLNLLRSQRDILIQEKKTENNELTVKNVIHTFVCSSNSNCQKIDEFFINHVPSCNEAYIQITYFTNINGKKTKTHGFYPHNGILIQDDQKITDTCKKIRRYFVNDKKILIAIGEMIKLIEKTKSNSLIESELLKHYDYFCWIMFKLNAYDEENDDYLLFKAFAEICYFGILIYIIFLILKNIYNGYFLFSFMLDETKRKREATKNSTLKKIK